MDPDDVQREIALLRARVLGGRGPGADEDELAAHQRDRELLGALPPATERAIAALQTAAARGADPHRVRAGLRRLRRTLV
jgi:hypothetical protein